MNLPYFNPLQFVAWFLTLVELILALYIFSFQIIRSAYRPASLLFLLLAVNNFGLGLMVAAPDLVQATQATYIVAITAFAIQPVLLLATVTLLKPNWLYGRWRWLRWALYGLALLPLLLLVLDVGIKTRLWYTGLPSQSYVGGFVPEEVYAAGILRPFITGLNFYVIPGVMVVLLLYIALKTKSSELLTRQSVQFLLAGCVAAIIIRFGSGGLLSGVFATLISSTLLALAYAYVALRHISVDRAAERGGIQRRLTVLVLAAAVPILVAVTILVTTWAGTFIIQQSNDQLQAANQTLKSNVSLWLRQNVETLNYLVSLPDITSMDPERQEPILKSINAAYPHLYLVHTTDLNGINVARSDGEPNKTYYDRLWYLGAVFGKPVTFQNLISRTTGKPALSIAAPIKDEKGKIVGVGSIVSEAGDISLEVEARRVGATGFAYVVDDTGRVVAHPNPAFSAEFQDLSAYPPVVILREGTRGFTSFRDEQGQRWRAYVEMLDNGWGIIVQQPESEALAGIRQLQWISWTILIIGAGMMLALIGLTTRRVLRPVGMLADTALAISQGDLTRPVPVESEDELGVLAHAFNSMTEQLRSLTTSLEERVAARTQRLELVAVLGEHLSGVLNLEELLGVASKEIKDNFGYYHVQVYLFDEPRENLLLVDGVGEAGAEIKAQGHRIPLSTKRNLITRAANTAQVVKVDDVREEEDWLPNPLLPDTVSEMVVPIIIEGQVAGILDVQENRVAGLDESDASLLRSVANQIAVAINNSRLFQETQSALAEVETLNRQLTREMWQDIHRKADTTGYVFTKSGTSPAPQEWMPAMTEAIHRKNLTYNHNGSEAPASQLVDSLAIPLTLRGEIIGVIGVERSTPDENNHASRTWSEDELVTVQTIAEQIALALDSARLSRETKQAAWRDRIVSEATAKVWASAELEEVMKTAVAQLGDKLRASEVVIRLGSDFDALQPNA